MAKTAERIEIPNVELDRSSQNPLHIQIYDRLRRAVLEGALKSGARLPSSRALAEVLGVSRTTVLSAYEQLLAEGYVTGRIGEGTRVAAELPEAFQNISRHGRTQHEGHRTTGGRSVAMRSERMSKDKFGPDLRIGQRGWRVPFRIAVPALDAVPFKIWSRLVSRHLRRACQETMDYQDGRGLKRLRTALAAHLSVSRGVRCSADQVLITAGAQSAIDLAARVLLNPGEKALIENPSHLGLRGALRGAGAEIIPVPVDENGLTISNGPAFRSGARLVFVTPSNQFPLAVTMSLSRRLKLLDWAMHNDAWILEDDYDSEFRFAGRPVEALQALDKGGRVLYIGSFSKVLYPGLRLGYLIVPQDLVEIFTTVRRFVDVHPPILCQAALADFIEDGHFARHVRRMRVLYGERGQALKDAMDRHLAGAITAAQPQAGMHMVGWLAEGMDDRRVADAAARQGVEVRPLSLYWLGNAKPGLVLGFGAVSPKEIDIGARKLARAVEAVRRETAAPIGYHGTRVPRPAARAVR